MEQETNDKEYYPKLKYFNIFIIFLLIWVIIGLAGFIKSLMCFGNRGSNFDKTMGMIIASIFGPFYWIYFYSNKNYCLRM